MTTGSEGDNAGTAAATRDVTGARGSTPGSLARLAVVGGGAMGEALARGVVDAGLVTPRDVVVADPLESRREVLARDHGVVVTGDPAEAASGADAIVLAVKQGALDSACQAVGSAVEPGAVVVSIVAGVPCSAIERRLPAETALVRAMPNTPALVRKGVTAVAPGAHADEAALSLAEQVLSAVGVVVAVDETALDAVTAVSGSGPAYWFLVAEAMIEAGVRLGLTRDQSTILVQSTMAGSAALLIETGRSPADLRSQVTSPAGTTAAALASLERHRVRYAFLDAIDQAARRSAEFGVEFS